MRAPNPARLSFTLGLVLALTACSSEAPSADERRFTEGFVRGCLPMCERFVPDRECPSLCECRLRELHEGRPTPELMEFVRSELGRSGGSPTQALMERVDRADLRCGGALLRAGYLEHCIGPCVEGALDRTMCRRLCDCSFDRIRQHPSPELADAFYSEHLAGLEPDAQGAAIANGAAEACLGELVPVPTTTSVEATGATAPSVE